ncbi:YkgJ family cysteine cluster protein [Desulfocurvus sp. DL9XJH121]
MSSESPQDRIATAEKARVMLEEHLEQARAEINRNLEEAGLGLAALSQAMRNFAVQTSALTPPGDVQCRPGCAFCCHTRASASIPEVLVIAGQLRQAMAPRVLDGLRGGLVALAEGGDATSLEWWLETRTPCPFLLTSEGGVCAIYDIRPFTCRSQHSTDAAACRKGFEEGRAVDVPCYPLLRRGLDIFSSAFISVMRERGLPSYQVGFVAAMAVALSEEDAAGRWLAGEDVFRAAEVAA